MSATAERLWKAGSADYAAAKSAPRATSAEIPYLVRGAADEDAAVRAALAQSPDSHGGLTSKSAAVRERLGDDSWEVAVRYASASAASTRERVADSSGSRWTYSTTGATQHIDTPLKSIRIVKNQNVSETVDHPGCIEPDEDGRPRGVDIPAPVLRVSEHRVLRDSRMTDARRLRLAEFVGSINLRPYGGFRPGELRYDGAEFSDRLDDEGKVVWDVTLNFSYQPTQTEIDCGDDVIVPAKAGWDYLWKQIQSVTRDGKVHRRVYAAFVDRIYRTEDFGRLLG